MGKKPRVVMLGPARNVHGGVSTTVNNLIAAGLTERVNLTYIGTMADGSKGRKLLQAIGAYLRFLTALPRAEIIHVNMSADASYYRKKFFIDTAHFFRKRIVISQHGGDFQTFYDKKSERGQKKVRQTLNKAEAFLVLTPEWKEFFLPLVAPEKIAVFAHGVLLPKEKKTEYSSHKLLHLGRLCREKGVGELLDVMPRLKERFPTIKLYLGGVWESKELKKQAERLGELVEFVGWLDKAEKEKYYRLCTVFVLPTYFEGQSHALLEAMAAGMTVLATAVGGIPYAVKDGVNGRLIAPKDSEVLYSALAELLENEELCRRYGEAARTEMETRFSMSDRVGRLVAVYEKIRQER